MRTNVTKSLRLWKNIFHILGVSHIKDKKKYERMMDTYEQNVKELYEVGGNSFRKGE